nr:hypothetical protein [Tanacetum cinerariifolium]
DVPEIYMQEFWATAKLHQHSIRFKMDTRKHVIDLEAFREMLHISPRISGQSFAELPFEEEILEFLSTQRLRIGRSNFRLPSDIQSKESTLQVVYDVLRRSPFFRAFLVTADVPEIYMQEFWATTTVHQHSIRFKMDTKKHIVDLEAFREMLHISPRFSGQYFAELPFEEEILEIFRFLGHSAQIKTLTDVNVNKLYQPWRSFAAVINKNVDYAFLIWEDLVYQVEHKNQKKSNEMYYPRFMTKKPSIPRQNRVNWYYVRDDILFSTIKVVSRHQNTQQYGAILPTELTTEDIRNTKAYKEYYAYATREAAPKPKASARKKKGGSSSSTTPPTPIATPTPTTTVMAAPRLSAVAKEEISWNSSDDEDVDDHTKGSDDKEGEKTDESDDDDDDQDEAEKVIDEQEAIESGEGDDEEAKSDGESEEEETKELKEESFDPITITLEDGEDDGNGEEDQGLRISEEERMHEKEEADELYRDVDINQGRGLQVSQDIEDSHVTLTPTHSDGQQESSSISSFVTSLLNPIIDPGMESIFTTGSSTVTPIPSPKSTMTPSIITTTKTASQPPVPSDIFPTLPTFASVFCFEDRVKSLEVNFSNILGIVHQYMHQQMSEAV